MKISAIGALGGSLAGALVAAAMALCGPAAAQGRIDTIEIVSDQFAQNRIGLGPVRRARVYLPEGYGVTDRRYPVLYALHHFFENETALFDHYDLDALLDSAIAEGRIGPVIVVAPDFSTPAAHSLHANSPVTGNWETYMVEELVPHIDASYRTLADRDSRGIFGNHIGGTGAIRFAARYPEIFGAAYALHPVATGLSHATGQYPDWERLQAVETMEDLSQDWSLGIFTAFYQAYLPNPDNPPFYYDPPVTLVDGERVIDADRTRRLRKGIMLSEDVPLYADNLKSLNGLKFDWGRYDTIRDHIIGNQHLAGELRSYGVPHEAEEYNGGWDEGVWEPGGRIDTDLLPFFAKTLSWKDG